jgi:hypothetical protein
LIYKLEISVADPDTESEFFLSRILIKELSILTQKIVSKLSELWSGLFIPDPGSATLLEMMVFWQEVGEVPSKEAVDQLMVAKWRYSQTYSVASASEVEERQPLW